MHHQQQSKATQIMNTQFNEAQLALLDMLSMKMTKAELASLKRVLSNFCAELAQRKIDKLEAQGKFPTQEEIRSMHKRVSRQ